MRTLAPILLAVAASSAHAESPRPLAVVVHGSIDGTALRAQISRELGTPVTAADRCPAVCLAISIADGKASVAYTRDSAVPRTRIVDLGRDAAQWPLVITLLAGNVVRDEAADVLAQLPAPPPSPQPGSSAPGAPVLSPPPLPGEPATVDEGSTDAIDPSPVGPGDPVFVIAPPPTAPQPVTRDVLYPQGPHVTFGIGLVPGLSSDGLHVGHVRHMFGFHAIAGVSGGSSMLSISGIADVQRGDASGLQVGGIAAVARRVDGIQLAGIATVSRDINGVQVGGIAAVSDLANGLQIGGIATLARRGTNAQIAGIASVSNGPSRAQVAGIATLANGDAGLQAAGIAAAARGNAELQVAGIGAVAQGRAVFQAAGIGVVAGESSRLQLGGIGTLARGVANVQVAGIGAVADSSNLQIAGIGALSRGAANYQLGGIATIATSSNLQVAGIGAISRGTANLQVAGITNHAGSANVQIAGIVNVAGEVRGVQLAPINIARRVEGVQLGVVNVGGDANGFSFGLINIVPGGRADLEAAMDSGRVGTLLFRHGGNRWHNVYGIGGQPVDEGGGETDDVWMYGLGFGPSWKLRSGRLDADLVGWQVNHGARHSTDVSILGQLRVTYAHDLGRVAIVAGGVLNGYVSDDRMSPLLVERRGPGTVMEDEVTVTVWPSAFVGVRL